MSFQNILNIKNRNLKDIKGILSYKCKLLPHYIKIFVLKPFIATKDFFKYLSAIFLNK